MGKHSANNMIDVNSVCLHYAEEGAGGPIILVHGNGESHDLFILRSDSLRKRATKYMLPIQGGMGQMNP